MKKQIKFDITDEMLNKVKKICVKEGMSPNQYIARIITDYILSMKVSTKINDNRYQILQILKEELGPIITRYEQIMDRIEEDYAFIREGVNDDE